MAGAERKTAGSHTAEIIRLATQLDRTFRVHQLYATAFCGEIDHTQKRVPQTNLRSSVMWWDFWSQVPEALHQVTILFSDRGIPAGIPFMNGYGSHTYSFINADYERFWIKFHFKTQQGIKNMTQAEGDILAGKDPDYHTRHLFEIIANGDFPKRTFCVQVMPEVEAETYRWNPFDLTKV